MADPGLGAGRKRRRVRRVTCDYVDSATADAPSRPAAPSSSRPRDTEHRGQAGKDRPSGGHRLHPLPAVQVARTGAGWPSWACASSSPSLIVGAAAFKPIKDWYDLRAYSSDSLERDRRQGVGLPEGHHQEGRGQPGPRRRRHADELPRRPAGLRHALEHVGQHGAQALHRPRTAPSSASSCTTSSTATRSSGTTRPSPTTPTRWTSCAASPPSSRAPPTCATSSRPCRGRPRTARPSPRASTSPSPTGRSAASARPTPSKQVGVWQYCSDVSGAALETFMEDYPYMDSPEPNAV